jgi:hypothetical protein
MIHTLVLQVGIVPATSEYYDKHRFHADLNSVAKAVYLCSSLVHLHLVVHSPATNLSFVAEFPALIKPHFDPNELLWLKSAASITKLTLQISRDGGITLLSQLLATLPGISVLNVTTFGGTSFMARCHTPPLHSLSELYFGFAALSLLEYLVQSPSNKIHTLAIAYIQDLTPTLGLVRRTLRRLYLGNLIDVQNTPILSECLALECLVLGSPLDLGMLHNLPANVTDFGFEVSEWSGHTVERICQAVEQCVNSHRQLNTLRFISFQNSLDVQRTPYRGPEVRRLMDMCEARGIRMYFANRVRPCYCSLFFAFSNMFLRTICGISDKNLRLLAKYSVI